MIDDYHKPVFLREVLSYLDLKQGDIIFDGTLGGAGHTIAIIKDIAPTGMIIGADLCSKALSTATSKLKNYKDNVFLVKDNFSNIKNILRNLGIEAVDGILLDLGLSSFQIDRSKKGFSYIRDEKLDMRFGDEGISAYEVVNDYSEEKLKGIFYKYGQEKWSKAIAANIVKERKKSRIETTSRLAEIVRDSVPRGYRHKRGHPAKRVFQAIRIEVNSELENLEKGIEDGFEVMKKGARMVVISYHSLEDRIVKDKFLNFSGRCTCPPDLPVCRCGAEKRGKILTRRVLRPEEEEIIENPRAKSAKLRAIEKL
ncbi:MAG: 16S rRNA (cytosine(1402)-N(4))-methyltransferase RsmH [Actinomycetota bacterium]